MNRIAWVVLFLLVPACSFADVGLYPFYTRNLSPVAGVFGLPAAERGSLVEAGHVEGRLVFEAANNFTFSDGARESIVLDGEIYRNTLALRWGAAQELEFGADLPVVSHDGGVFDSFIESWHDTFDLPGGDRSSAPDDRLHYSYSRNGVQELDFGDETTGLGDLSLHGGWQLYRERKSDGLSALSLRASLKLPTGDSDALRGSGALDAALRLNWERQWPRHAVFASFGGMYMAQGDVLPDLQKNWAAFGSLGGSWRALPSLALKLQLDGHTPFYERTSLRQLGDASVQLVMGGTLELPGQFMLDAGVSEDIVVETAPDVVFHLALLRRF